MTRSLYVLRHAKAEDTAAGGDHARALKGRGRRAAQLVGRYLTRLEEAPELVLCSSAVRARDTAETAREAGAWKAPIDLRGGIYEAGAETLRLELGSVPNEVQRLLLVGHQPGLGLLIALFTGSEPAFPTAALARLDFESETWSELAPRSGHLCWLVTPEVIAALRPRSRN